MGKKIRINTGSLNSTKRDLQDKLTKIKNDMAQISEDMGALNSMWEGDAHQSFQERVNADIEYLTGVCDGIQNIINYESNAVTEYDKCEQQVSDLIAQIRI